MIKFRCPNCNQKIGVAESYAGKRVRCAKCQQPLTVPKPEEVVEKEPAASDIATDKMFEEDMGDDKIFGDEALTEELLDAEASAPAIEEALELKPLAPKTEREMKLKCPKCGALNKADSEFCTTCANTLTTQVSSAGMFRERLSSDNMALSIGASIGLTIVGGVVWCIIAGLVGVGWVSFMAVAVCCLAGLGLTQFTDRRGASMGLLAILIGFIGIISSKLMIAKWVVMPKIMPEMKKFAEGGFEDIKWEDITEEQMQDTMANAEMMFALTLMELVDEGEFEEEFARKVIVARFTRKRPPELEEEMEQVDKRVYECLGSWDSEKKESVVRKQYPRVIGEFAGIFLEGRLGEVVGFIAAFFGTLSCLDIVWFPLGLFCAYKIGTSRG